jgi:tyrosine aminotransferase
LTHIAQLIEQYGPRVRGIVVNNPSNPTGAVFPKQHLVEIVQLCDHYKLPIVADEVYGDLVFGQNEFVSMANVAKDLGQHVPVITASGIGKQFVLPGWRVGWAVFQDK